MTAPTLHWIVRPFADLSLQELHDLLRLRTDVFVVEQHCAYAEVDGLDPEAHHVLGTTSDGTLIAYARILPPGTDGPPHIGRVVVATPMRGQGLSRLLMEQAIAQAARIHGHTRSVLSAQAHLRGFYASLGYRPVSEEYLLDGIPHVDMRRD